jgi:hypothetical protein
MAGRSMSELDKYSQLVKDLDSGELVLSHVIRAIRTHIERNENIPEGVRNLLSASEGRGYLQAQFKIMRDVIGMTELAYRRGVQEGEEKPKLEPQYYREGKKIK